MSVRVTIPKITNAMVDAHANIAWSKISKAGANVSELAGGGSGITTPALGGTGADLSATGGTGKLVKQESAGANFTVGALAASELPTAIDAAKIADGSVSNTEFQYLNGVTSAIQTQINAAGGGGDPWVYVKTTSDFPRSDQTPTLVPGLSFTPAASKTYVVHGQLVLQTANATGGACPGVIWPTNCSDGVVFMRKVGTSVTVELLQSGNIGAAVTFSAGAVPANNASTSGLIEASFTTASNVTGDFQITLRNVSGATIVKVMTGSWIAYRTIA